MVEIMADNVMNSDSPLTPKKSRSILVMSTLARRLMVQEFFTRTVRFLRTAIRNQLNATKT